MELNNKSLNEFSSKRIFVKYAIPGFIGLLVGSLASLVDGIFVARFVGPEAFAAINIVFPVTSIALGVYVMFTIGATALAGQCIGENNIRRANLIFSQTIVINLIIPTAFLTTIFIFRHKLLPILGAGETILPIALDYIVFILLASFFWGMGYVLDQFIKLNGSPKFASAVLIIASLSNIVLDALFVAVFEWGVKGAGFATALSYLISFVIMIFYFLRKNCRIKFIKIYGGWHYITRAALNGASEFLGQTSAGITTWLFNITAFKLAGTSGILAYSATNYLILLLTSLYYSLSESLQPLISISLGSKNIKKMKEFLRIAITLVCVIGITAAGVILIKPSIVTNLLLAKADSTTIETAILLLRMVTLSFIGIGINMVMSSYYTSVQCAGASIIIASMRSLILPITLILLLSRSLGIKGIALVIPITEAITVIASIILFRIRTPRKRVQSLYTEV